MQEPYSEGIGSAGASGQDVALLRSAGSAETPHPVEISPGVHAWASPNRRFRESVAQSSRSTDYGNPHCRRACCPILGLMSSSAAISQKELLALQERVKSLPRAQREELLDDAQAKPRTHTPLAQGKIVSPVGLTARASRLRCGDPVYCEDVAPSASNEPAERQSP